MMIDATTRTQALATIRRATKAATTARADVDRQVAERDRAIAEAMALGLSPRDVAEAADIDRSRVYQILAGE